MIWAFQIYKTTAFQRLSYSIPSHKKLSGQWNIIESMMTVQPTVQEAGLNNRLFHIFGLGAAFISLVFNCRARVNVVFCRARWAASFTANNTILACDVIINSITCRLPYVFNGFKKHAGTLKTLQPMKSTSNIHNHDRFHRRHVHLLPCTVWCFNTEQTLVNCGCWLN